MRRFGGDGTWLSDNDVDDAVGANWKDDDDMYNSENNEDGEAMDSKLKMVTGLILMVRVVVS